MDRSLPFGVEAEWKGHTSVLKHPPRSIRWKETAKHQVRVGGRSMARGAFRAPSGGSVLRGNIDCYEVVPGESLGSGGNGYVALVKTSSDGREFAAKIYNKPVEKSERVKRFRAEREVMKRLDHHAIVTLIDDGEWDGRPFFIMPRARCSLMDKIKEMKPLPADFFRRLCLDITDALALFHGQPADGKTCWHRDIKPENVLLFDEAGTLVPRLSDFGVAHLCPSFVQVDFETRQGAAPKSHYCYAPEQLGGEGDQRSDVFSWAFVLWWAATGRPPRGAPSAPSSCTEGLDVYFDQVLVKALDPEPDRRYASMAELRRAFAACFMRLPQLRVAWERGDCDIDGVRTTEAELKRLGIAGEWRGATVGRSLFNGVWTPDLASRIERMRDREVRVMLGLLAFPPNHVLAAHLWAIEKAAPRPWVRHACGPDDDPWYSMPWEAVVRGSGRCLNCGAPIPGGTTAVCLTAPLR